VRPLAQCVVSLCGRRGITPQMQNHMIAELGGDTSDDGDTWDLDVRTR